MNRTRSPNAHAAVFVLDVLPVAQPLRATPNRQSRSPRPRTLLQPCLLQSASRMQEIAGIRRPISERARTRPDCRACTRPHLCWASVRGASHYAWRGIGGLDHLSPGHFCSPLCYSLHRIWRRTTPYFRARRRLYLCWAYNRWRKPLRMKPHYKPLHFEQTTPFPHTSTAPLVTVGSERS